MKYFYFWFEELTFSNIERYFKPLKRHFYFGSPKNVPISYCQPKGLILDFVISNVEYKVKDEQVQIFMGEPHIRITFFRIFTLLWYWTSDYWDEILWYLKVKNIKKARETYPWKKSDGTNAWTDECLNSETQIKILYDFVY